MLIPDIANLYLINKFISKLRKSPLSTPINIGMNVADAIIRNPLQQAFGRTETNENVSEKYNAVGARLSRMQADINARGDDDTPSNPQKQPMPTKVGEVLPFGITARSIKRFNKNSNGGKYANFGIANYFDAFTDGLNTWEYNNGQTSGQIQIDPDDESRYIVKLTDRYTFDDESNSNDKQAAKSDKLRGFLGKVGRRDNDSHATKQIHYYYVPRENNDTVRAHNVYAEDYSNGNPSKKDLIRMERLFTVNGINETKNRNKPKSIKPTTPTTPTTLQTKNYKVMKTNNGFILRPRKKAFIGALIGAGTSIAGSLFGAHQQKKAMRAQQRAQNRQATFQEAANLTNAYANDDIEDDMLNRIVYKLGGQYKDRLRMNKRMKFGGRCR